MRNIEAGLKNSVCLERSSSRGSQAARATSLGEEKSSLKVARRHHGDDVRIIGTGRGATLDVNALIKGNRVAVGR